MLPPKLNQVSIEEAEVKRSTVKIVLVSICLFLAVAVKAESMAVDTSTEVDSQIKSCLVDLYIAQQKYFEVNDIYASSVKDLKISEKAACKGIQISCEIANAETFVIVGKARGKHWTLDESKALTQVQ